MRVPPLAFFITKYFGSGVIIATAFIHVSPRSKPIPHRDSPAYLLQLLAPAVDALTSPCLTGPITDYDWAEGIALMTVFTMFFIELMAARFDIFGRASHDIEASDPAQDLMRQNEKFHEAKVALRKGLFYLLNCLGHAQNFQRA
jgi:solute carrier family 39 (zinc transporter), member 1/2/3